MDREIGRVLVVGAGVAGIRAALDLAETGYEVFLTESSPAVGGVLSKLDNQFPTDHCGMCRMLPFVGREHASQFCMRKSLFHDNITILEGSEVIRCEGEPGSFEVTLRRKARLVDTEVCMGEGDCAKVCPIEVSDEFNEGLTPRKAIYRPVPHNLPNLWVIDSEACDKCGECVKVCPVQAIHLDAEETEETLAVGAVVLAAGSGLYRADTEPDFYAYGRCPNVLTSLEFERTLSSSGTFTGELRRPHDAKPAKKIAWLQCVGSRNRRAGRDFCSSICCMFALKEAVLAKERGGEDTEVSVFYMDMRTFGKDYYRYREAAQQEKGVRLIRCRAPSVHPTGDQDPVIRYFGKDGLPHEEKFDLVVLATGQTPPAEMAPLQRVFGFELDEFGFARLDAYRGVETTQPGIFACGSFSGLKDISEALIQGSAAAVGASELLRAKGLPWKESPPAREERAVAHQFPLVSVILCRWPLTEGTLEVDFDRFAERVGNLDQVMEVHVVDEVCRSGLERLEGLLHRSRANRVLYAACLPYVYRRGLKQAAEQAGFNATLVEVVDLRGEVRRVQRSGNGATAEQVAYNLIRSGIEALAVKDPVRAKRIPVERRALVIGGGVGGLQVARTLSRHGAEVVLAERSEQLGGRVRELHYTLEGYDPRELVDSLVNEVQLDERITVLTQAEVLESDGSVGRFTTRLRVGEQETVQVVHGTTIVATGGREAPADGAYGHGQTEAVVTQEGLEKGLADGSLGPDRLGTVVMIQCVGSREPGKREYCSRICCFSALKNALKILEVHPEARVLVLYRDLMSYGFKERYFTEARRRGVIFSTYETDQPPQVTVEGTKPTLRYTDCVLGREVSVTPDLVVLSTGVVPNHHQDLAQKLGLELNADGFFDEVDYKFRPVEMIKEGVYVCGLAHSPRSIPETLVMAQAAAQQALSVLSRRELTSARLVSRVRHAVCAVCEQCIEICPYEARSLDAVNHRIVVDELACQGCGLCVAACPSNAASFAGLAERQIMAELDAQLSGQLLEAGR